MKFLSGIRWGSDRKALEMIYKTIIRSKLDYACQFYGSGCQTDLKGLDIIQNQCLRMILGAQKTSPIISLQVEANIPPLQLRRKYLSSKYRLKISNLNQTSRIVKLFQQGNNRNKFLDNTNRFLSEWRINIPPAQFVGSLKKFPPWYPIEHILRIEFGDLNIKTWSNSMTNFYFKYLVSNCYPNFLQFFTDGSKTENSSVAAFVIPSLSKEEACKLPPNASVFSTELIAILKALLFLKSLQPSRSSVIFTDSYSSISLLREKNIRDPIAKKIINLILELNVSKNVFLQWIPGHQGIPGNEAADRAAKRPTHLTILEENICMKDRLKELVGKFNMIWGIQWERQIEQYNKGRALRNIRTTVGNYPWAYHKIRAVETSLTRLRLGHSCLKQHLFRFRLSPDPYCNCGEAETVEHFLLHCPAYFVIEMNKPD